MEQKVEAERVAASELLPNGFVKVDSGTPLAEPISKSARIPVLDVIRGVAVLGILVSNLSGFCGPVDMDNNPTAVGTHNALNIGVWLFRLLFVEGKMRAAFSMLFGAGTILLLDRAESKGLGAYAGDLFVRRNLLLMIFGMLDGYLLWVGDILYWYGLVALLFLYPFRKAKPKTLFVTGLLALALVEIPMTAPLLSELPQAKQLVSAHHKLEAGQPLTPIDQRALAEEAKSMERGTKNKTADLQAMRGSYWQVVQHRAKQVKFYETDFLYFLGFADSLGMMLMGMGLFRSGFLTGSRPNQVYWKTVAICYPISLSLTALGASRMINAHFSTLSLHLYIYPAYQFVRLVGALANIALIILICRLSIFAFVTRRLAAVGQMALTNYVLTSLLCALFFFGYGLGQYGRLEYYQAFFVVGAVWLIILASSSVWLRHFQYGPLEWIWRSLTYARRQSMLVAK